MESDHSRGLCPSARRGKPPMVIIGAAMRKLIHLAGGVLKSGRPYGRRMLAREIQGPTDFSATLTAPTVSCSRPLSSGFVRLPGFATFASAMSVEMTLHATKVAVASEPPATDSGPVT
jgi:hypothetical protein